MSVKWNIFDDLPSVSAPIASNLKDELQHCLDCPVEDIKDPLMIEVVAYETSTLSLTLPDGSRLPVNTQCALFYISHT
jgi:hypothetical protein